MITTAFVTSAPTANLISLEVGSDFVEYVVEVSDLDEDADYSLIVKSPSEVVYEEEITEDGIYEGRVEGLLPEWEYTVALICHDAVLGDLTHFKASFQTMKHTEQLPDPPSISVSSISVVGENIIRLWLDFENAEGLTAAQLELSFVGRESFTQELNSSNIKHGYVDIPLLGTETELTVTPSFDTVDEHITLEPSTHTLSRDLEVEVLVDLYQGCIRFNVNAITHGATAVRIRATEPADFLVEEELRGYEISVYYSHEGTSTYTLSLIDESGEVVSNEVFVTVDTSLSFEGEYSFHYVNPSDAAITYNDDGTINVYLPTTFERENEDIYYIVRLGDYEIIAEESPASITHIPNDNYSLSFFVCKDVNGVCYSTLSVYVSGTVNELTPQSFVSHTVEEGTVELGISNGELFNLDGTRIELSNGEVLVLNASDFTYDSELDIHYTTFTLGEGVEFAKAYLTVALTLDNLADIAEYEGTPYMVYEYEIYP